MTTNQIIYDGDCPFCSHYVKWLRLQKAVGAISLVDIRTQPELLNLLITKNMPPDKGMVLVLNDVYYHGADCMHKLALLSSPDDSFNKLHYWIFRSRIRATILYPILRTGRNLTLRLLGRKKLS